MEIQSLSVVVPSKRCVNNCKFCVSRMRTETYANQLDGNKPFYDLYEKEYKKRLEFARDNGCNTVMLTGNAEPQQNRSFLEKFGSLNARLVKPFRWVEMQTTGVLLDRNYLRFLRNHVGVSTISLSVSSFNDIQNAEFNDSPKNFQVKIMDLCDLIKEYDFNLRISVNLTSAFADYFPQGLFEHLKGLEADQATFRVLYAEGDTAQSKWIAEHSVSAEWVSELKNFIAKIGRPLEILPFGAQKLSVNGIGTVLDADCMSTETKSAYKYLILRPDCKLYSKWDDTGSLIF